VLPTGVEKLVIDIGVTLAGALPGPVSVIDCGVDGPSSLILSWAVLVPETCGEKVTRSWQLLPGRIAEQVFGEGLFAQEKSLESRPVIVAPEKCSVAVVWLLVIVTTFAVLVVPTSCARNVSGLGARPTATIPVPDRFEVRGVVGPLFGTESMVAGAGPMAVGENVT
jgi:hypothetical protein